MLELALVEIDMLHAAHNSVHPEATASNQAPPANDSQYRPRTVTGWITKFVRRTKVWLADHLIGAVSRGSDLSVDYAARLRVLRTKARLSAAALAPHKYRPNSELANAGVGQGDVVRLDDFRRSSPKHLGVLARPRIDG